MGTIAALGPSRTVIALALISKSVLVREGVCSLEKMARSLVATRRTVVVLLAPTSATSTLKLSAMEEWPTSSGI